MPDLSRNVHFDGEDDVSGEDLGGAEVANFSTAVDTALQQNFGWSGKAIGAVALTLSPDNDRVASGMFVTRGETDLEEYRATCDQIWPAGPRTVTFAIRIASLDSFTFSSGGLWSDIIPSHKFTHGFFDRNNVAILGARAEEGWGEFALRIVCQLSSTSSGRRGVVCKFNIILFPASAEELSNVAESRFAGYPGLKIAEGHFPLGPAPSTRWQCPIVPLIRPGTPFVDNENAPSSVRLRFAVSAVMRKVVQPDMARSSASLHSKWERLRANPLELANIGPATTWPEHQDKEESLGEY
jgi:hypothetical protein